MFCSQCGASGIQYSIYEHVHRLAAWAASTAARSAKGSRFNVKAGKAIIEKAGLKLLMMDPSALPAPEIMDQKHRQWRNAVIRAAATQGFTFTHGLAAKLINTYLKIALVTIAHHDHERVKALHPPIDRELLTQKSVTCATQRHLHHRAPKLETCRLSWRLLSKGLAYSGLGDARFWRKMRDAGWSKYDAEQYESVIKAIRAALGPNVALWTVEKYWPGFQG